MLHQPGGGESYLDSNGHVITDFPDGSSTDIDPDAHTSTLTRQDGSTITTQLNAGDLLSNPDGSTSHLDSDGRVVTEFPDGSVSTIDPDTGDVSLTDPEGTTTSGSLDGACPAVRLPPSTGTALTRPTTIPPTRKSCTTTPLRRAEQQWLVGDFRADEPEPCAAEPRFLPRHRRYRRRR
ncbi:hypothetical protein NKH18_45350 [Streptomyces sp. M10(2022)]